MINRVLFFCFIVLSCPGLVFGLEVHFKDEARVSGPMLTLGEVADVRAGHQTSAFENMVLFPAPESGEQRCYDRKTLKAYICDGLAGTDLIEWSGAETICIRQDGSSVIGPEEIQARIDAALRDAVGHLGAEDIAFELRNPPQDLNLTQGEYNTEVLFSDPNILESRQVSVIVRVNDRVVENLTLAGRVRASVPVLVAAKKMKRGTVLRREHLLLKKQNIAGLQDPFLNVETALGKRLKRSVSMNQVLRKHDLEKPVIIKRRQMVTMFLEKGPLQIQAKGMAVTEGREGEQIMVRNMRSKREVSCTVLGPGLTKVEF